MNDHNDLYSVFHDQLCRRAFLGKAAAGFGAAMSFPSFLGNLALGSDGVGSNSPVPNAFIPGATAKRMIVMFTIGGLSQLDLFDEKPLLSERRGEEIPKSVLKDPGVLAATQRRGVFPVVGSKFEFSNHGQCGMRLSELMPGIGSVADDVTLIRTLRTDHSLHEAAISQILTGTQLLGRPSWGSWISYALGSENQNLPEFVVLMSNTQADSPAQPRLWHSGFLPGEYQGVQFRGGKTPVLDLADPPGVSKKARKSALDILGKLNDIEAKATGDPEVETRIRSYEMAARMQTSVPELTDLSRESDEMLAKYGAERDKPSFARNCLLARRLAESDVRFTLLCDGGWDHHENIPRVLPRKTEQIDQPIGALIADLRDRGLLDDTIVMLVGEFGRTPHCENGLRADRYGRDHHPLAAGAIIAGGGFKKGYTHGTTDEWGWDVVEDPVHIHDLQATVLRAMGLDHERLTFRHEGRDFRLTDVGGNVIDKLLV